MSWTKTSERGYAVATETVTMLTTTGAVLTSVIDFLPPGVDFTIITNADGTDLSADADVDLHICDTSTGTFAALGEVDGSVDNAVGIKFWDVSTAGEAPYYKLNFAPDGNQKSGDTVKYVLLWH